MTLNTIDCVEIKYIRLIQIGSQISSYDIPISRPSEKTNSGKLWKESGLFCTIAASQSISPLYEIGYIVVWVLIDLRQT